MLEVDGRAWRNVPDEVVAAMGLFAGMELERPVLRRLRAELRRSQAFAAAGRALAHRDLSLAGLRERLDRAGVPPAVSRDVVGGLADSGLVDDARLARRRALALAKRGYGDAAIAARLEAEGIDARLAHGVVAELRPEGERARSLVGSAPDRPKAAATLARRGFAPETIEDELGSLDAGA